MIERFLSYSLRWQCPVKLVYMSEGQLKTGNITVVSLTEDSFDYITARKKKTPQTMRTADVLAASYARGDDGDTAKKQQHKEKEADVQ
ncbi:MAG: hypothetical protein GXZ04_03255 [Clostridiales bacterium]|nr:hypothetical protein [Clostridiales bacterium]